MTRMCFDCQFFYRGREQHGKGREAGDKGTGSGRARYGRQEILNPLSPPLNIKIRSIVHTWQALWFSRQKNVKPHLATVWQFVSRHVPATCVLVVLMKLKLNLSEQFLAHLFDTCTSLISQVLSTWLPLLAAELRPLLYWPKQEGSRVLMTPATECRSMVAIDTSIDPRSTCRLPLGQHVDRYMIYTRPTTGDGRSSVNRIMCRTIVCC